MSVNDLRHVFDIGGMYKGFSAFRTAVLMPAVEELRANGAFISCNPERKKRGIGKGVKVENIHLAFQLAELRDQQAKLCSDDTPGKLDDFDKRIDENTRALVAKYGVTMSHKEV